MKCVKCGRTTETVSCPHCGFEHENAQVHFLVQPSREGICLKTLGKRQVGDFQIQDGVLIRYTGHDEHVVIPDNLHIHEIGEDAFIYTDIQTVRLPRGLKSIGAKAFLRCTALTTVELPDGLTSIGYFAFYDCTALRSIELPAGLTFIASFAFSGCTVLNSIKLPAGLTSIGGFAFFDCTALTEVVFQPGTTQVDLSKFDDCVRLKRIEIPDSVTTLIPGKRSPSRSIQIVAPSQWLQAHPEFFQNGSGYVPVASNVTRRSSAWFDLVSRGRTTHPLANLRDFFYTGAGSFSGENLWSVQV